MPPSRVLLTISSLLPSPLFASISFLSNTFVWKREATDARCESVGAALLLGSYPCFLSSGIGGLGDSIFSRGFVKITMAAITVPGALSLPSACQFPPFVLGVADGGPASHC